MRDRYGLGLIMVPGYWSYDLKLMKFDRSTDPINKSSCQPIEVCDGMTGVGIEAWSYN